MYATARSNGLGYSPTSFLTSGVPTFNKEIVDEYFVFAIVMKLNQF
jgi:hypothetical protein